MRCMKQGRACVLLAVLFRIQAKYIGQHGQVGGCPAATASDPEPETRAEQEQEPGISGDGGKGRPRSRGAPRRRLGSSAQFMSAEIAKLKKAHGEDYEPSADDIDRIRAALVAQQ